MAVIKIYIEKFGKEVLIDEDHPLAVAQKKKPRRKPKAERPEGSE